MEKITVVTVCYNAVKSIERTIQSVITQTYPNIEYLIIDGGSKDGTLELIDRYRHKISRIVSEPDKGIYDAMNKAIELCNGDLINFLNAGDTFVEENTLRKVVESGLDDTDVVFGDAILAYGENEIYSEARIFSKKDLFLPFCHQSVFVRSEHAKKYPFDLKFKVVGDYNFFYKLYVNGKNFKYIHLAIAKYDMDGFSHEHVPRAFMEIAEITGRKRDFRYYIILNVIKFKLFLSKITPKSLVMKYRKMRYGRAEVE